MPLGSYYLDLSESAGLITRGIYGPLDAQGIPLVDYDRAFRWRMGFNGRRRRYGIHYTPVTIAEYALGLLGCFATTQSSEFRSQFLKQAEWLRNNLVPAPQGFKVWLHQFEFPVYQLKSPWVSAMAQGEGISVLLRAYELENDQKYLEAASQAFGAFQYDIAEGGVCIHDGEGNLWLEEFPTQPPLHVLNGFVFALWGVFDFYRVTGSTIAYRIWQSGIATLKKNLHYYELPFGSCYDLFRRTIAPLAYHRIHIRQLVVLEQLTGEAFFGQFAQRWQRYADRRVDRMKQWVMYRTRGTLRRMGLIPQSNVSGISFQSGN